MQGTLGWCRGPWDGAGPWGGAGDPGVVQGTLGWCRGPWGGAGDPGVVQGTLGWCRGPWEYFPILSCTQHTYSILNPWGWRWEMHVWVVHTVVLKMSTKGCGLMGKQDAKVFKLI